MNFQDLHELLRQELLRRIDRGDLTGTALARDANFRQAHISNFLRGRRSLSQQGLDRVLAAQHLTVGELIEARPKPLELSASAGEPGAAEPGPAQRFVAIRADGAQAAAMDPVIPAGATVVVDRHYNSLAPYRAQQRTVYAVRTGAGLVLRYVDLDAGMLILRPLCAGFPVQLLALGPRNRPEDAIVGRVCLVLAEL